MGGVVPSCSVCTLRGQHYPYLCHYSSIVVGALMYRLYTTLANNGASMPLFPTVLWGRVAFVHYGCGFNRIYPIIFLFYLLARSCIACTLRGQHYPYLCHYSFGLTNG